MSFAVRVALLVAALSMLTAALVTGSAIVSTTRAVNSDIDIFLEGRAEELANGTRQRPGRIITNQAFGDTSELDAQVQWVDDDGTVVGRTGLVIPVDEDTLELLDSKVESRFNTTTINDVEYRVYTTQVQRGGNIPGGNSIQLVQVATSIEDATSLVNLLRNRLLIFGTVLAVLAAAIGWFVARQTIRPLAKLTEAAERVAQTKQLDSAIAIGNPDDEIGRLATSFNEMLKALESSREQQHQLVQDAAHELRTPLTSVNANIDLLMHAKDLPVDERQEVLTGVRSELRQLGTLFTEIIELATDRQQAAAFTPVDLVNVAERAVEDLARRSNNPVTIDATPSIITGDFNALHRALTNLLSNAVKYSPTDSPINVTIADGTVSVRDHGSGIPVEERERIFDRFHRLIQSRPMPGSGLGLAIVAKIVADHGGHPFVEDANPGPGAVVGFKIPTATIPQSNNLGNTGT